MENDDALFKKFLGTRLEGDVKKKIAEIIKDIDPNRIKVIYEKLNPEQRANLEMLFEKVKLDSDAEKIREINKMIDKTKIELNYLDESVHTEQAGYKAQNLRREKQLEVNNHGDLEMSGKITEEELKSLNKILDGDTLIEEKFNKFEKSLKSDFRKAINILKDHTSLTELLAKFSAQSKAKNGMPDWQTLIPSYHFSDKEIKKIQKGYEAYLAANIGNPETSRWNEVIDALETGLLNEGKSLGVVVKETVNEPISKKERKLGLKKEKESWKSKNRKDMNYDVQKEGYIQKLEKQGWSKADATNAAEKRIEEQQNKDWKKYLKEQEKL